MPSEATPELWKHCAPHCMIMWRVTQKCLKTSGGWKACDELLLGMQVTTLTVYALLEAAAAASEGNWLAQTAGGSFLGRQIISLAKHRGVKVVNLVRRAAQKEELLSLGYVPLTSTRQV